MKIKVTHFISIISFIAHLGTCDLYSSIEDLKSLLLFENDAVKELNNYIDAEVQRLAKLRQFTQNYLNQSHEALQDPERYVSNPINSFLLIKKLSLHWNTMVNQLLENPDVQEAKQKVVTVTENFPGYDDLDGAAAGIIRLQDTYRLDPSRIAEGDLDGIQSTKLTAEDCYHVGRYAYNMDDMKHTAEWMGQALSSYKSEIIKTANLVEILDYLAFAEYEQGNIKYALELTNQLIELDPSHSRAISNKQYYEKALKESSEDSMMMGDDGTERTEIKRSTDEYRMSAEFMAYEALCRNEETIPNKYKHRLVCRYTTNNHPLLRLRPAKLEELYLNPYIVLYHDVISDEEIEEVKALASSKLNRATVHNSVTGKLETAFYRVSKSAWLRPEHGPVVGRLRARFQAMCGVNFATGEDMQMANYGVAGQYEPHFDFARKRERAFEEYKNGNRIATWLTYLSDVEKGGATVFPRIGLKVFPKKGTAAFWYNLYRNGEGIVDTRHAACPVLVGSKWVSNIWLHEGGNEFTRPCSLNADE